MMSGAQLVAFPFLLLMLPTVAGLAWWLKRRYCAAIIRLQKEAVLPETAQGDSATTPESVPSVGPRTLPKLRLRILPAQEIPFLIVFIVLFAILRQLHARIEICRIRSRQLRAGVSKN